MAKKTNTKKVKKTQAEEDADFTKFLQSDAGAKLLNDEKKMKKTMKDIDKFLGLKF
jgi:hypothetical protein